jgi:hypothetical protein
MSSMMPSDHHAMNAEGLWQFKKSVPIADDQGKSVNDTITFLYADGMVTLRLLTLHLETWKSPDDFYKLATDWRGNVLYYRPPFGDFVDLAEFENGRFVDIGNGVKRIFERITPDEVVQWNRDILKPRLPHDYRIQPVRPA